MSRFNWCPLLLVLQIQSIFAFEYNPEKTALIIIDVQNDFCSGGSLPVPEADGVVPVINQLRKDYKFQKVIFTLDWHPPGHVSFFKRFNDSEKYPGAQIYEDYTFDLLDGKGSRTQRLWPVHCVQNTTGAELRAGLTVLPTDLKVFKGIDLNVDSYSAFLNNDKSSETELDHLLKDNGIEEVVLTGLAFDICVGRSALDGVAKGYKVQIIKEATRPISASGYQAMEAKLQENGVKITELRNAATAENPQLLFLIPALLSLSSILF